VSSWIALSSLLTIKNPSVAPLHLNLAPPCRVQVQFPPSLLRSTHDFVREDAYKPPLSPLYKGPYLVVSHSPKYLFFQVGSKTDSMSVDRLKSVLSKFPVTVQEPPHRGRPHCLRNLRLQYLGIQCLWCLWCNLFDC